MRRWAFGLCLAALLVGCTDAGWLLAGAPCPCAADEGFICCPTTQVCTTAEACPAFAALDFSISRVEPAKGRLRGGEEVVVWGQGFRSDMEVRLGGVPCEVTTWRAVDRMACMTPPGPQLENLVSVSVHRPDGASVVQDRAFRYQLPDFSDITEGSGIVAAGFGAGVTVWDADLDGRRDVLMAPTGGLGGGMSLFLNRGDLHFEPQDHPPWVSVVGVFSGAVVADFTQDGLDDLFVANQRHVADPHLLVRSPQGDLSVVDVAQDSGSGLSGPSALDVDGDGDLDVVACRDFVDGGLAFYLGRNEEGRLQDDLQGLPSMPSGTACTDVAVADYDRDGDADLLFGGETLTLLENRGGNFVDVTAERGLRERILDDDTAQSGGATWVDLDYDGDLDVAFVPFTNFVTGNAYLLNSGVLIFESTLETGQPGFSQAPRLDAPAAESILCSLGLQYITPDASLLGGGRSAVWFDVDLDGDQDLISLMPSVYCVARPWLYTSLFAQGERRFTIEPLEPGTILTHVTGAVAEDFDGDGDMDVISHQWGGGGGRGFFRNNLVENVGAPPRRLDVFGVSDPDGDATDPNLTDDRTQPGLTFEIDLDGPDDNPDFELGPGKLMVSAHGASSQASSSGAEATFGLAGRGGAVWVRTIFPDGSRAQLKVEPEVFEAVLRDCGTDLCL